MFLYGRVIKIPILKKSEKEKDFVQIPNELLRRKDLSLPAKGLLCYMLSCSEGWKFSIKGLSSVLNTSEHLIGKYLTELETLGYHKKESIREGGKIVEWKYFISDYPAFLNEAQPIQEKEAPVSVTKKSNLFDQCLKAIEEEFIDPDVKHELGVYLDVRIRQGRMSAKSWRTIILELRQLAKTKEEAIQVVQKATCCGYMKLYPVNQYSKSKRIYADDITVTNNQDEETRLKQKYLEEVQFLPKCDRISFEDWKKALDNPDKESIMGSTNKG